MENILSVDTPSDTEIGYVRDNQEMIENGLNAGKFDLREASHIREALLFKNIREDIQILLNAIIDLTFKGKVDKAIPFRTRKASSKKKFGSHGSQRHN
jgi:hypothetical protein